MGFDEEKLICVKPERFSGLLNTEAFCFSALGAGLESFKNKGGRMQKREILASVGPMSFVRIGHMTASNSI